MAKRLRRHERGEAAEFPWDDPQAERITLPPLAPPSEAQQDRGLSPPQALGAIHSLAAACRLGLAEDGEALKSLQHVVASLPPDSSGRILALFDLPKRVQEIAELAIDPNAVARTHFRQVLGEFQERVRRHAAGRDPEKRVRVSGFIREVRKSWPDDKVCRMADKLVTGRRGVRLDKEEGAALREIVQAHAPRALNPAATISLRIQLADAALQGLGIRYGANSLRRLLEDADP